MRGRVYTSEDMLTEEDAYYASITGTELGERVLKELMALIPPQDTGMEHVLLLTGSELLRMAEEAGIPHSTHSRLLRKLVKLGLVKACKGFDTRVRLYAITPSGARLAGYLGIDLVEEILEHCKHIELGELVRRYGRDVKLQKELNWREYVAVERKCIEKFGKVRKYPNIITFLKSLEKEWVAYEVRVRGAEFLAIPKPRVLKEIMCVPTVMDSRTRAV